MSTDPMLRTVLAPLAVALLLTCHPALADDAILVLDASGSMWGQIEGKTKVEIARGVIGGLLDDLPAARRLGLVAYGHRREADCADIEEVVPVGTDRAAIRGAVNGLAFKGRTPLSAAVKFAAEKLRYEQQPATVILVSDGVETCNLDPCALGRALETAGVDFTAHVIGFGLANDTEAAGLQCLAEATGGRYIGARSSADLASALDATVAAEATPPAPQVARVILRATELDGGPEIDSGLAWAVRAPTGAAVLERANAGVVAADIGPGTYEVTVVRAADGARAAAPLDARAGGERTVTIPLQIALAATVSVTPAGGSAAGSAVSVAWTGPDRDGDYVTIVKPGADASAYQSYANTSRGNPASLELPAEPGDYEIRYVLGRPQRVLAAAPYQVTEVGATVTAPASGVAGGTITIAWTGPNYASDWLTVVRPDAAVSAYADYLDASKGDGELELPIEPGAYEVRYVQDGKKVLARVPLTVTDAAASSSRPRASRRARRSR
jgi:Ca-activated chloride channel homolog